MENSQDKGFIEKTSRHKNDQFYEVYFCVFSMLIFAMNKV